MTLLKQAGSGRPFAFPRYQHDGDDLLVAGDTCSSIAGTIETSETAELTAELQRLAERLADADARIERARSDAHEQGYKEGLQAADQREAERLSLLVRGVDEASENMIGLVRQERDLAIEIARAALASVLGNSDNYTGLVVASAEHWATRLQSSAVLRLRVSSADFADAQSLEPLRTAAGRIEPVVEPELPSGSCIFDLELGEVDASIPGQSTRVDAFLAQHQQVPGSAK